MLIGYTVAVMVRGRSVRRQAMRASKTLTTSTEWHYVTLKEERRIEEAL